MPLSLKTMEVQIKREKWNKRFRTVQVYWGKRRRICNYVSGIWIPPPIPLWLPINWAVRFLSISANVNKHWKTRAKGNDIIANVISPNQHFASTFSMQIFKFQRRSCKVSSPAAGALWRACSQARITLAESRKEKKFPDSGIRMTLRESKPSCTMKQTFNYEVLNFLSTNMKLLAEIVKAHFWCGFAKWHEC